MGDHRDENHELREEHGKMKAGRKKRKPAKEKELPKEAALRKEIEELKGRSEEYLDMARRARADFDNYQKRVARDRQEWSRQAVERFVAEFLPALDGLAAARFEDAQLTEAVRLIDREFLRVLAKSGIVPIEASGKPFDPAFHEAVGVVETSDHPDGAVVDEVRRGWMIDGRVLRASSVRIAKALGATGESGSKPPE